MNSNLFTEILTPVIAIVALILSLLSFYWNQKVSILSADNNIIQYVAALLVLLERVKGLDVKEREIFKKLLEDAKFFEPTTKAVLRNLALEQWPVDKELKQYFKSI